MMALLGQQDVVNPVSFAGVPSSALEGAFNRPRGSPRPRTAAAVANSIAKVPVLCLALSLSSQPKARAPSPPFKHWRHRSARARTIVPRRGTSLALRCRFEGACINLVEDSARRVVRRASHNAPRAPGAASVCQRRAWSDACEAALGTIGRWTTRRSVALIIGGFFGSVLAPLCRRHISKQEQVAGCTRANTRPSMIGPGRILTLAKAEPFLTTRART